ncbi:MAG: PhaM family polyhydroxyalkanoate granule multifunctional regulatory protein [Betaproteobacteria bacterium]
MSEDYSKDLFDFFQKMWNPTSFPMPGIFTPSMSVEDIDKKLNELRSVESWLKVNLSFLQMTIKTLDMQKSALDTLQQSTKSSSTPGSA